MYDHNSDKTIWVPQSAILIRPGQKEVLPFGLAAEQAVFLQALEELQASRPVRRRTRLKVWQRLRTRLTQLPA